MMRVLVTGATGFIGRALVMRLLGGGHHVAAWVRDDARARDLLGREVELVSARSSVSDAIARADAVVNLAGESVFGGRWTEARKKALTASRVDLTRSIAAAIEASPTRPSVFVSASAVGFYGDRGDAIVEDDGAAGDDFLARLCRNWESAAMGAAGAGTRVFIPRIGIVLGVGGGALATMSVPFRLGVGGPIGTGRQYVPWIHIEDLIEIIVKALSDPRLSGAMIAAAPNPVTNLELSKAIAARLHRPCFARVPAALLKLALGEAASMLLGGQRARPTRLERSGFSWRYPAIDAALDDIFGNDRPRISRLTDEMPAPRIESDYFRSRRPRYVLVHKTRVDAPIERVFDFFSRPANLGAMTPARMQFQIVEGADADVRRGLRIRYRLRIGPLPVRWTTLIEEWEAPVFFADSQQSGPYRSWWHEHHFAPDGNGTLMEDRVYYSPLAGPMAGIVNAAMIAPMLSEIFAFRAKMIKLRFGRPVTNSS